MVSKYLLRDRKILIKGIIQRLSKQILAPTSDNPVIANARMAGDERRTQILQIAMRLFSHRGFRGTTTREIAVAAGVSEAMVFRHFATKEDLYAAILDHKACAGGLQDPRELVAADMSRRDDRAVFEKLAVALMDHHEQDTEFLRLLTHSALEGHQLAEMFWDRNVRSMYEFLSTYIRERQREGALRDIEPAIVVRAFISMIIHHSLNNTLWDTGRRLLDISNERAAHEFTNILLQGINAQATTRGETIKRKPPVSRNSARKKQTK
jgi:AcrR family transcriptional regulator